MNFDYESIKILAKQLKRPVTSLIALASANDPFYQQAPRQKALAEWFANIYHLQRWDRFRVHIRRCHYLIVSLDVSLPSGKHYENSHDCWRTLLMASKSARYLGLVPMDSFDDHRNDEPISYVPGLGAKPEIEVRDRLWSFETELPDFPDLPDYLVSDYTAPQRYHTEIWCEKTSVNDILLPLAKEFGAVLQTGAGELSISLARLLAKRLQESGKQARIFYISDYDPAGQSMPVAVSRKLEFFVRREHLDIDARIFPLVLTREQVQTFRLPRTPIKPTERRRSSFEKRHGAGAVELDALEALVPGELERIVRSALSTYYDHDLERRVKEQKSEVEQTLKGMQEAVLQKHGAQIAEVRAELEQIRADLAPRMQQYSHHLAMLWHGISADLHQNLERDFELDGLTEADAAEREFGTGLYDSQRDYLDQIAIYRQFQGKEQMRQSDSDTDEEENEEDDEE
jgi:hypothetical protein